MDIKEKRFEQDIESYMLKYGGYTKGDLSTYNRENAIDLPKLIQYIKATQPKEWQSTKETTVQTLKRDYTSVFKNVFTHSD